MSSLRQVISSTAALLMCGGAAHGIIDDLNSETDNWTALELYGRSDYTADQQANSGGDIVGDADGYQSGFYKQYDTGMVAGISDDSMAFRIRLDSDAKTFVFIGLDIQGFGVEGAIDFFVRANIDTVDKTEIAFYNTGGEANTSPSTTGVGFVSNYKTGASDSDFADYWNLSSVSATNDSYISDGGSGATDDLDQGGATDHFLSFQIDMVSLNNAYKTITGATVDLTESTEMSFIAMTAKQDNSLNQDFAGVPKDFDGTQSWIDLGISSQTYTAEGTAPVPEPSTYALLFGAFTGALVFFRRRR